MGWVILDLRPKPYCLGDMNMERFSTPRMGYSKIGLGEGGELPDG